MAHDWREDTEGCETCCHCGMQRKKVQHNETSPTNSYAPKYEYRRSRSSKLWMAYWTKHMESIPPCLPDLVEGAA